MLEFSDEFIERLIKGVYDGEITEHNLPDDLYYAIANYLKKGLYKGFGGDLTDFESGTKDLELLEELRENVYMFSAAKTYQQVLDMREALVDENDNIRPWSEFKEMASDIFDQYNENWLSAEYDTAIGQAQNAAKWNDIEKNKEVLPLLKYSAVEDDLECEICIPLNDLVAPVDDPIWDIVYPENHFRCRCLVLQLEEDEATLTPEDDKNDIVNSVSDKMNEAFKMNAGKDKIIYSEKHPYFSVAKGDKDFAKENFGLPIPKNDEDEE